jgi:hypothetical protein
LRRVSSASAVRVREAVPRAWRPPGATSFSGRNPTWAKSHLGERGADADVEDGRALNVLPGSSRTNEESPEIRVALERVPLSLIASASDLERAIDALVNALGAQRSLDEPPMVSP